MLALLFTPERSTCSARDADMLEVKIVYSSPERVADRCRGESQRACTIFDGIKLASTCSEESTGWHVRTHVRAIAHAYLTDSRYLQHEMAHVGDLRKRLSDYEEALGAVPYPTEPDCRRAMDAAHETFEATLKAAIRASIERRDADLQWTTRKRSP